MLIASRVSSFLKRTAVRSRLRADYLLSPELLAHEAMCERSRVDRNGSVLAILRSTRPLQLTTPRQFDKLSERLQARLRITDTAGWSADGRLTLLLPDTPLAGALQVANELCEQLADCVADLDFEIGTYPDSSSDHPTDESRLQRDGQDRQDGGHSSAGGRHRSELVFDAAHPDWPRSSHANRDELLAGELVSGSGPLRRVRPAESLLAVPCPRWKRAIDIAGACVGLVVAAPLVAVAAVAVKLTSPGDAFFCQQREGLGGQPFRIYKLRTMRADAESLKASLRPLSEQDGPAFKMAADPRITPIGRLLRKTSIDELPQLWNVLKGDMSLVGPRPLPVDESQGCLPWQRQRLSVRPGLTCIWQVRGRNTVSFDEWMRMDLRYIRRQQLWYDLFLIASTGPSIIAKREGQCPDGSGT